MTTATTDVLIPALQDAREAHSAVIDRFRFDLAVTPAGPHRQTLERHLADTRTHVSLIDDRLEELRPHRIIPDTIGRTRRIARNAAQVARLPLDVATGVTAAVWRGGVRPDERRLLENAEDEYAITARALAACRAGERIATQTHDDVAAELFASLRRQDEQVLQALEGSLTAHAGAVATAGDGHRREAEGGLPGAAVRTVRAMWSRVSEAAKTRAQQTREGAPGSVAEMPGVARAAGQVQGAASQEEQLPIAHYGRLTTSEITRRLRTLPETDLAKIEGYERAHDQRPAVLSAIAQARGH